MKWFDWVPYKIQAWLLFGFIVGLLCGLAWLVIYVIAWIDLIWNLGW